MTTNNITIFFILFFLTRFDLYKVQKTGQNHNYMTVQLAYFQESWPLNRAVVRLRDSTLNWNTKKGYAKNREKRSGNPGEKQIKAFQRRMRLRASGNLSKTKSSDNHIDYQSFIRDPSGARTQDPNIKSVVLYQLS